DFTAVHARGLYTVHFFTNPFLLITPTTPKLYGFRTLVTPYDSNGKPSAARRYELWSHQYTPQAISAKPSFDAVSRTLLVTGTLSAGDTAANKVIEIYATSHYSRDGPDNWGLIGSARTDARGNYAFTKKLE